MLRRLVGVAALTAALVIGAAVPALAQDVTPRGCLKSSWAGEAAQQ